jgi:hypothetical protein
MNERLLFSASKSDIKSEQPDMLLFSSLPFEEIIALFDVGDAKLIDDIDTGSF